MCGKGSLSGQAVNPVLRRRIVVFSHVRRVEAVLTLRARTSTIEPMDKFAASFDSGLLRLQWAPGTFITYEIAVQAARVLEKLGGGQTLPLLVDIAGVAGLAAEARTGMNAYRGFSIIALLGDHPVGTVLAAFAKQSLTPTAYFTDEESALRWLAQQNGREYRTALTMIPDTSERPGHTVERSRPEHDQ